MLQRRRLMLMVLGLAGLTVIGVGLWAYLGRGTAGPPGVTRANAYRLHPGITLEEVEAILGPAKLTAGGDDNYLSWRGDDLTITVGWLQGRTGAVAAALVERRADGTVRQHRLFDRRESLLDRVRRWLHL